MQVPPAGHVREEALRLALLGSTCSLKCTFGLSLSCASLSWLQQPFSCPVFFSQPWRASSPALLSQPVLWHLRRAPRRRGGGGGGDDGGSSGGFCSASSAASAASAASASASAASLEQQPVVSW